MVEEQDRHSKALDAELVADPDERARVEARNGLEQFDAVIELIEYSQTLSGSSSFDPPSCCTFTGLLSKG